ncbi:unnamed protein product, partial [Discosporangium mesarthrocarpum]
GFRTCEPGFFCTNGKRTPCPAGTYGDRAGITESSCSGFCPAGTYCPEGSVRYERFDCFVERRLWSMSHSPFLIYLLMASSVPSCPSHLPCSPTTHCGNASVYCPLGSAAPRPASKGYYTGGGGIGTGTTDATLVNTREWQKLCPKGSFCQGGVIRLCPPGSFGNTEGLGEEGCQGVCPAGWYCPLGSVDPYAFPCRGRKNYCPEGSGEPMPVLRGHYAAGLSL